MNLNKEALLKAKPDLIVAHESQKHHLIKYLKRYKKWCQSDLCERCSIYR